MDVPTGSTAVEFKAVFFIFNINAIYAVDQSYNNLLGMAGRVPWAKFKRGT
jgi:hypothetical protein